FKDFLLTVRPRRHGPLCKFNHPRAEMQIIRLFSFSRKGFFVIYFRPESIGTVGPGRFTAFFSPGRHPRTDILTIFEK
ncbi:hypothetical protein, partial [Alistipes onderdonkii]|uniref:hypothetical protein n=1 Tax=Alistipes onderdonkii TaxID=328813 RepID=UPI0032C17537